MRDIALNLMNIQQTVENVLNNVEPIANKKRNTKNIERYLYCGGGYDTESTTIMNGDKPDFAFVYHVQIMINGIYIYFRDINLCVPFFTALSDYIENNYNECKLIIWVANLAHEWAFFKRQLAKVGITDLFAKSKRQPLKITIRNCIEFRECLGLWGRSLAHIAETYTKTQKLKGDLDYKKIRTNKTIITDTEYQYNRNDVQILDELSYVAFDKFTKQGLKIPMTQTGILRQKCKKAIYNYKSECAKNKLLMPKDELTYFQFRKYLYCGGLSGSNIEYIGKELKHIKCADITSDYPAQINHRLFPDGELKECAPCDIHKHKHQYRIFDFVIDVMQATTKHAVFSKHKILNFNDTKNAIINNGKISYIENVRIMINDVDLKSLMNVYNFKGVHLIRCWYFTKKAKAPKFLLKCMNEDYLIKNQLKENGKSDTIEYKERKANTNSYYGMCATRLYDCICKFDENEKDIKEVSAEKEYNELIENIWLSPYIAYWCTSYARQILIDMIAKYPRVIVQYDTDSLYYRTDLPESQDFERDLQKWNTRKEIQNNSLFEHNKHFKTLGQWEIDKEEYKNFKCLGAKRYLLEKQNGDIKPVVAGLPKQAFKDYCKKHNVDPFKIFENDLVLNKVDSTKLASAYYDGETQYKRVTDYTGFTDIVEVGTYHALYDTEFTMKLAAEYIALSQAIQEEKALPPQYRFIENVSRETFKGVENYV